MFDLSWGVCKTNGGKWCPGWIYGFVACCKTIKLLTLVDKKEWWHFVLRDDCTICYGLIYDPDMNIP